MQRTGVASHTQTQDSHSMWLSFEEQSQRKLAHQRELSGNNTQHGNQNQFKTGSLRKYDSEEEI